MQSEKVRFTKEKETLLFTLYGKALHSRSKNPVLHDKWAEGAVDHIDYDFDSPSFAFAKMSQQSLVTK